MKTPKPTHRLKLDGNNISLTNADAFDFLSLSTAYYCPQYQ